MWDLSEGMIREKGKEAKETKETKEENLVGEMRGRRNKIS